MAKDVKENKKTTPSKEVSKKETKKSVKIKFTKPNFKDLKWNKVLRVSAIVLAVIVGFGLIDLFVQYLNNDYSVAVVNGQRITKNQYHERLENAYGVATAQQLIDESIIKQEAKMADVSVSKEEVDNKINEIIASIGGQDAYEAALISSNITDSQLRDQIELDLLTTKLLTPSIEYSDEDLKDFFDQYSEIMFANESAALEEGEKLNFDDYKDQVEEIYIQQEVEREKSLWLADKQEEYKIQNNAESKSKYGVFTTTVNIFKNLFNEANSNTQE